MRKIRMIKQCDNGKIIDGEIRYDYEGKHMKITNFQDFRLAEVFVKVKGEWKKLEAIVEKIVITIKVDCVTTISITILEIE